MDTSIFLHTMRYKFVIIICLRIFGSVGLKRGDMTHIARSQKHFSPKLEPIHRTSSKVDLI